MVVGRLPTLHVWLSMRRYGGDMSLYRRLYLPGGTYFFTVNLQDRGSTLLVDRIDELRGAYAATLQEAPWTCHAMVVLPDHLHALWTLPPGDADFSERWRKLKARFTRKVGNIAHPSPSQKRKREAGIWQRRFWEHAIRDQRDFDAHMRYCWVNPVKHGYVDAPEDWPYSSIHGTLRAQRAELPAAEHFGERL